MREGQLGLLDLRVPLLLPLEAVVARVSGADEDPHLLGNGHLELSIYVRSHKATLRLTEHKTVVWIAEDNALKDDFATWLKELGISQVDKLVCVRDGAHFHYRPAKSRDRAKLGEELYRQRLRKVYSLKTTRA